MKDLTYEKLQKLLVGKWLRNDGEIERITTRHSLNAIYTSYPFADTPQELIQDNDLGFIREWNTMETLYVSIDGIYCYMDGKRRYIDKHITCTEIWTRTDKDTYKCQWRK